MKKYLVFIVLIFTALVQFAQNFERNNYNWGSSPKPYKPTKEEETLAQFDLLDKRTVEFLNEGNQAFTYYLRHSIKFVNSDEAIQRNNKIYLPYKSTTDFIANKIRVIKPNGEVIEVSDSDIKEAVDEKTELKYKYYALRGVEKGSTIEQLTIKKSIPILSGTSDIFQDSYLSKNIEYELIYPKHLVMEVKSYNGFPELETDTSIVEKIRRHIKVDVIAEIEKELYANETRYLQRVSYKLVGNKITKKLNLNSFSAFAETAYSNYQAELTKADAKAIEKFFKKTDIANIVNEEQKIKAIENHIKNQIRYESEISQQPDVNTTITNKIASLPGLARLFCAAYKKFNIENQIVITSDRFVEPFDPKFENHNHLSHFILYFPKYKKYVAPTEFFYRYPLFPHNWGYNYGLFIKETELGGVKMGLSEKKMIDIPKDDVSKDTMNIEIDLTTNQINPNIKYRVTFEGYSAVQFQPIFDLLNEEQKDEFRWGLAKNYVVQSDKFKVVGENEGAEFLGKKPFAINFSVKSENLTEKAGKTLLLKVGETIGRQQELYQKGVRKLPIELDYPHAYFRKIKIVLPDNYTVSNLKDLKMRFTTEVEGKEVCGFYSDYSQNGNVLTIENKEFYHEIAMPLNSYKSFESVINAAADFNKIVLALEPK